MENTMIKERIEQLREDITTLDNLYELNQPTILRGKLITDSEYDEMYLELESLEMQYPEFYSPNSPTQKMPTAIVSNLDKVKHSAPMLSQEKVTTVDGLLKFVSKGKSSIIVQEKLDGLTIVLTYENGKLKQAVTRGDGYIGEDVTHTVSTFKNVPKRISFNGKLEIRMEALVPYAEFERINVNGEYSNPRNLASGTVRQLDASIAKERNLIGIAFDLISAEGMEFTNDLEMLEFMKSLNLQVVNYEVFENTQEGIDKLIDYVTNYDKNIRKSLPYMIDGLVLKFNDLKEREELGYTSKHPRWGCAYKFKSLDATTKLLGITDQVGKTGQITPVAELETINIDGVNISRATLHNYGNIKAKDIRIGDQVVVIRANDVIPQVVSSVKETRTGEEVIKEAPATCPVCGAKTEFDGENLFCTGIDCKPQLEGKLKHYVSRNALNIDGLGKKTVEEFFSLGIIENITDIYKLESKKEQICNLEKFGEKKFQKIIDGVNASKSLPLNNLLYGLSIRHIGETSAKELAKEFKTMDEIINASKDIESFKARLLSIKDFGEAMANSVIDFFSNDKNVEILSELKEFGINMKIEETAVSATTTNSSIAGKVFVITGDVHHFKNRNELKAKIEELGGTVTGSVSKNTDFLINNDIESNSSKNKKAKELNIPIISEDDFLAMI